MTLGRQELGRKGERLAERFLRRRGMKTVARRYDTPLGEIDLVMQDGDTLVFVEVKTRTDPAHADPNDNIRANQQRHLTRAARWFIHHKRAEALPCRFDVALVVIPEAGDVEIRHFDNAFGPRARSR